MSEFLHQLVQRPEDILENAEERVGIYRNTMLRPLEVRKSKVIWLRTTKFKKNVLQGFLVFWFEIYCMDKACCNIFPSSEIPKMTKLSSTLESRWSNPLWVLKVKPYLPPQTLLKSRKRSIWRAQGIIAITRVHPSTQSLKKSALCVHCPPLQQILFLTYFITCRFMYQIIIAHQFALSLISFLQLWHWFFLSLLCSGKFDLLCNIFFPTEKTLKRSKAINLFFSFSFSFYSFILPSFIFFSF